MMWSPLLQAVGPEQAYAECVEQLKGAEAEDHWRDWFITRSHFWHAPKVAVEIERWGGYPRSTTTEAGWRELGYQVQPQAAALEIDGLRYHSEQQVQPLNGARRLWINYARAPEGEAPLAGMKVLEAMLEEIGWQVRYRAGKKGQAAIAYWDDHVICVRPRGGSLAMLNRLGHEAGHVLLDRPGNGGVVWAEEAQAQIFAWAVAKMLGCDIDEYSVRYILGWTEGRQVLEASLQIQEVLRRVEDRLAQAAPGPGASEPGQG